MADSGRLTFSRRRFLRAVAVAAAPVALFARVQTLLGRGNGMVELEPTPPAGDQLELTPEEPAGPFVRPHSPLKNDLREPGSKGVPVRLSGFVLDCKGQPVSGGLLDFWHADAEGKYDFEGFRCRGHQFADASGRYALETIPAGFAAQNSEDRFRTPRQFQFCSVTRNVCRRPPGLCIWRVARLPFHRVT